MNQTKPPLDQPPAVQSHLCEEHVNNPEDKSRGSSSPYPLRSSTTHLEPTTLFLRCFYAVSTLFLRCFYAVLRCFYAVSTLFLRCIYAVSTLYLRCIYAVSTLSLGCLYTVSTLSLRCLHAVSTLSSVLTRSKNIVISTRKKMNFFVFFDLAWQATHAATS